MSASMSGTATVARRRRPYIAAEVSEELHESLAQRAKRADRSVASLIRLALDAYLREEPA